eukprot:TRINITY_DN10956_c0_g1_i3.p1 TRINITY_DN10956_c0_g1~~TRINITY_DN10956_c0_g1_i3.p1  ORF type:complete len:396 (-),score=63.33 TRINITY_DN10956_c0_g1_i3:245-1432(-)
MALDGVCTEGTLCLGVGAWSSLSAGQLDPREHGEGVQRGLAWVRPGVVVAVVARDLRASVLPLEQNLLAMCRLLPKVAVVLFENDSVDGTREALAAMARRITRPGCVIELIECSEAPDCMLAEKDRWDSVGGSWDTRQPITSRLSRYRNRVLQHVLGKFGQYSYMMVVDPDLKASWSLLGMLHAIGASPGRAVASNGRMSWPGGLGSLLVPYDFAAFKQQQSGLLSVLHGWFCGLAPAVSQMRAQCDAMSPFQLSMVSAYDLGSAGPYVLASAYNGAVVYPMGLLNETKARYSPGAGAECEHVQLHAMLGEVVLDPAWKTVVELGERAGPQGLRALKMILLSCAEPSWILMGTIMSALCVASHASLVMIALIASDRLRTQKLAVRHSTRDMFQNA